MDRRYQCGDCQIVQPVQERTEAGLSHGDGLWTVGKHDKHGSIVRYHASCLATHSAEIPGAGML